MFTHSLLYIRDCLVNNVTQVYRIYKYTQVKRQESMELDANRFYLFGIFFKGV